MNLLLLFNKLKEKLMWLLIRTANLVIDTRLKNDSQGNTGGKILILLQRNTCLTEIPIQYMSR